MYMVSGALACLGFIEIIKGLGAEKRFSEKVFGKSFAEFLFLTSKTPEKP